MTVKVKDDESPAGLTVKWVKHPQCAKCDDDLVLRGIHVEDYPYLHADVRLECLTCGEIYLFGIPKRKDIGLALHVMDTNPKDVVAYQMSLSPRRCPYRGHGEMLPTKIFGDWVFNVEKVEYQWKCPVCFLTRHEIHDRKAPHGDGYNPTEEEVEKTMERLRALGYIE